MFEKIGRAAEQMAGNVGVSRRGFLGRRGRGRGGLMILPADTRAGRPPVDCSSCDCKNK